MEDNMCDLLVKTYNVRKIDSASIELKDALKDRAIECCNENPMEIHKNERIILKKLINNYFNPNIKQPNPKYIAGPITLTVHESLDKERIVYIFGEAHTDVKNCKMFKNEEKETWNKKNSDKMTIDFFLYELMKTTTAYLDIYIEFASFERTMGGYYSYFSGGPSNTHLDNLFKKFKKCIELPSKSTDDSSTSSRSTGDCELARVHFFDSRRINGKDRVIGLSDVFELIEKIFYLQRKYPKDKDLIKKYIELVKTDKDILNSLGEDDEEKYLDFWKKELRTELNIKETKSGQYESRASIKERKIMEKIKDFTEKEIERKAKMYRKKIKELVTTIFESEKGTKENIIAAFKSLNACMIHTNSTVADVYLLARMFKDFDMTKMKTHANNITDQPDKAYNVIIYAGEEHSRIYRRYLKKNGFKRIASTGKDDLNDLKYCIDMRGIPPIFSKPSWTDLWSEYIVTPEEYEYKTFKDLINI